MPVTSVEPGKDQGGRNTQWYLHVRRWMERISSERVDRVLGCFLSPWCCAEGVDIKRTSLTPPPQIWQCKRLALDPWLVQLKWHNNCYLTLACKEGEARADHLLDGGSDSVLVLWCIESGEAGVFRKDSEGDRVPGSSQVTFSKPVWRHKATSQWNECLGIGLLGNHPQGRGSPRAVTLLVMGIQDRGPSWGFWKPHQGKSYFHRLLCPEC